MIHQLALHRLRKLRSSKIMLVFAIVCVFLGAITVLPTIIFAKAMDVDIPAPDTAVGYFQFVVAMGHLAALILGVTTWRQDYKDGTLLTFAARPISRIEIIVGKILGSIYALLAFFAIAFLLYAVIYVIFLRFPIPAVTWLYVPQLFMSWLATYSVGLFFSNVSAPLLAACLAIVYYLLGALGAVLAQFQESTLTSIGRALKFVSIDRDQAIGLEQFLNADISSLAPVGRVMAYYAVWAVMLMALSLWLFSRREFMGKRS